MTKGRDSEVAYACFSGASACVHEFVVPVGKDRNEHRHGWSSKTGAA